MAPSLARAGIGTAWKLLIADGIKVPIKKNETSWYANTVRSVVRGKFLQKKFIAMFFAAFSTIAWATPITGNHAKVVLCLVDAQQDGGRVAFNPLTQYGNPVRYARSEQAFVVQVGPNEYTVDMDIATEEAMAEWTAAVPSLRFQSITRGLETPKTWKLSVSPMKTTRLGGGYRSGVLQDTENPALVLYNKGFEAVSSQFSSNVHFMESKTFLDYLEFIVRLTAKHEIGHLLGFMHTPVPGEDEQEKDATGCATQMVFTPANVVPGPPIMTRDLQTTLQLMYDFYGRPLRLTDIQITPQEAAVARAVFEQNCPVRIEDPASPTGTSRAASTCPPVPYVLFPVGDAIVPLME